MLSGKQEGELAKTSIKPKKLIGKKAEKEAPKSVKGELARPTLETV